MTTNLEPLPEVINGPLNAEPLQEAPVIGLPQEQAALAAVAVTGVVELQVPPAAADPSVRRRSKVSSWFRGWFSSPAEELAAATAAYEAQMSRKVAESHGIGLDQAAELIETRGYVCPARRFCDQVEDTTRRNTFRYEPQARDEKTKNTEWTEHEGLTELREYLARRSGSSKAAAGMLENLTFIGAKEFAEAAEGLAAYWKRYLDSDPEVQLCALTPISGVRAKSDKHLLEAILGYFSDDELDRYADRLLVQAEALTAPVDKARIVLLDDWVISGSEMRNAYSGLRNQAMYDNLGYEWMCDYIEGNRVEVNVITVSPRRMQMGLEHSAPTDVPIKAYFLAHESVESSSRDFNNQAHISGTHSTVDFDFRNTLSSMRSSIGVKGLRQKRKLVKPAVAAIVRPYSQARPNFERVMSRTRVSRGSTNR